MTITRIQPTDEDHASLLHTALAAGDAARDQVTPGIRDFWASHVVLVRPYTSPFGRYLRKHDLGSLTGTRGDRSVTIFGGLDPCWERGAAWSNAVAAVLQDAGITAFAGSYAD